MGSLSLDEARVTEKRSLDGFRELQVETSLIDPSTRRNMAHELRPGVKLYWRRNTDGEECLYVIDSEIRLDYDANKLSFTAHEVAAEIKDTPPFLVEAVVPEDFIGGYDSSWIQYRPSGASITALKPMNALEITCTSGTRLLWAGASDVNPAMLYRPIPEGAEEYEAYVNVELAPSRFAGTSVGLAVINTARTGFVRVEHYINDAGTRRFQSQYRNPGGSETTVQHTDNPSDWPQNGPFDLCIRRSSDGTFSFQYKAQTQSSWQDLGSVVISSWTPTHIRLYIRNWGSYHPPRGRFRRFRFYPLAGVRRRITNTSVQEPHVNLTSLLDGLWEVTVPENLTVPLGGLLSPSQLLQTIQEAGFRVRYEYEYNDDPTSHLKRKLVIEAPDENVKGTLRLYDDATNLDYSYSDLAAYLGAYPVVKTDTDPIQRYDAIKRFKDYSVAKDALIPSKVQVDEEGTIVEYVKAPAPYRKEAGSFYILAEDAGAEYVERKTRGADGTVTVKPRLLGVEVDADHPVNMYWKLAEELTKANQRTLSLEIDYNAIQCPWGDFRVGDVVILELPGEDEGLKIQVKETEKSVHEPAVVKIKADVTGFIKKMLR